MRIRRRPLAFAMAALAMALSPAVAGAQWLAEGMMVCASPNDQNDPSSCSDGFGGAIIVWADSRLAPYTFDIYAQRVDFFGQPRWTANGVAICTASGNQITPALTSDGA